jgi:spore germination cell wall hydrolase CwlJ-like protein
MKTLKIVTILAALLIASSIDMATKARTQSVIAKQQEINCLAKNIYHEARGEPFQGQVAVALVTVNRVASKLFSNTVCGVVYAHKQFSWTQSKNKKITDEKAWSSALKLATAVLSKQVYEPKFTAIYFHTKQIKPKWAKTKVITARIGNHIFYG